MSMKVGSQLQKAVAKHNLTQARVAQHLHYARTTTNGYFNNEPAPYDFIRNAAEYFDDSEFNLNVSSEMFGTLPAMDGNIFRDNPLTLETIQEFHVQISNNNRQEALLIMTKKKENLTEVELRKLEAYASEQLDDLLIRTKLVIEILNVCDKSLMTAIKERKVSWIEKGYLEE